MKLAAAALLVLSVNIFSQVVNIESKRMQSDSLGWLGGAEANFLLSKNVDRIYDFGARLHFQHKAKNDLWLFLNEYRHIEGAGTKFVNSGFVHIRYNRKITQDLLRWEVFAQYQFNGVLDVRVRALAGTGLRFKIYDTKTFRVYAAALYMYEYEENINRTIFEHNHRASSYISFTFEPKSFEFVHTTYYQPKFTDAKDYRINSQTDLLFEIFEELKFKTSFMYRFDSKPFPKIPKETFYLANGLVFEF
jgi:hypothetical protein